MTKLIYLSDQQLNYLKAELKRKNEKEAKRKQLLKSIIAALFNGVDTK